MNTNRGRKHIIWLSMCLLGTLLGLTDVNAMHEVVQRGSLVKITEVPSINQHPELPTGCEATALTIMLQYYGKNVSKTEVANNMTRVSLPYYQNGKKVGPHPSEGFIGNPYSKHSYGVFVEPMIRVAEKYFPGRVENLTGLSLNEVLKIVAEGRPVMVWVTIGMKNVSYTQSWYNKDGKLFKWPNNEHAMIIIGYDSNYIYLSDPYTGKEQKYKRDVVQNRFKSLGTQALTISKAEEPIQIEVDNRELGVTQAYTGMTKDQKVWISLRAVKEMLPTLTYTYNDKVVSLLNSEYGIDVQLVEGKNKLSLGNNKVLHYNITNGITQLALEDLCTIFPMNYVIKGKVAHVTIEQNLVKEVEEIIEEVREKQNDLEEKLLGDVEEIYTSEEIGNSYKSHKHTREEPVEGA